MEPQSKCGSCKESFSAEDGEKWNIVFFCRECIRHMNEENEAQQRYADEQYQLDLERSAQEQRENE